MTERFHLMRKIVLYRKIRDQETSYIKELRMNPDYKGSQKLNKKR